MSPILETALLALALTSTAPAAASPPSSAAAPVSDADDRRTRPIVMQLQGLSQAELRDAIALRLPLRPLVDADAPRPTRYDWAAITLRDDGSVSLSFITGEGEAYDRRIEVEQSDRARAIAGALASLTFAIEGGEVEPDRTSVPQPEPPPQQTVTAPSPEPPRPLPPPPSSRPVPPPAHELGVVADAGVVTGLAPRAGADALAAGHGRIGLDLRRRDGALGSFGVRVGGRRHDALSLVRVRLELGGGWGFRFRAGELVLAGAMTLEPWALRRHGGAAPLQIGVEAARRRPLLGALVRVSPGLRLRVGRAGLPLRLGVHVELAGSFVPDHGARTIEIGVAKPDGTRALAQRMGGLELHSGLELALWFPLPGR
ncbi:MAG: hypothetical protein K1X88_12330 [Nannocystaceae bacterium]|nr:hypothetical protein [Nannocystaceae bacterium]